MSTEDSFAADWTHDPKNLHDELGLYLAAARCSTPLRPCPLHVKGATMQVREVLGIAETRGWALRKVHAAPGETVEEILEKVERGLVTH